MKILSLDLGKFNSVCCLFDTKTRKHRFLTTPTQREHLAAIFADNQADLVVMEACGPSGWINDLAQSLGLSTLVCSTNEEAWRWANVKRKTDKDDALKLAHLAAMRELKPVHTPFPPHREFRSLVKYRKTLDGRITKPGNPLARTILVECAWASLRYNPWAKGVYERICGKQKTRKKKAGIALARKIAVIAWAMLRDEKDWEPKRMIEVTESYGRMAPALKESLQNMKPKENSDQRKSRLRKEARAAKAASQGRASKTTRKTSRTSPTATTRSNKTATTKRKPTKTKAKRSPSSGSNSKRARQPVSRA